MGGSTVQVLLQYCLAMYFETDISYFLQVLPYFT